MSNALRVMQCLPFGRQSTFYQPLRSDCHNGSRLMSLFTAGFADFSVAIRFFGRAVAEEEAVEDAVIEEVVVTGSRIARKELISVSPVLTVIGEEGNICVEQRRILNDFINIIPRIGRSATEVSELQQPILIPSTCVILVQTERWCY